MLIGKVLNESSQVDPEDAEPYGEVSCMAMRPDEVEYNLSMEEVNIDSIERYLEKKEVHRVSGLFSHVFAIRRRAVNLRPDGQGWLPVTSYQAPTLDNMESLPITGLCIRDPEPEVSDDGRKKRKTRQEPFVIGKPSDLALAEMARGIPISHVGKGLSSLPWESLSIALPQATHQVRLLCPALMLLENCAKVAGVTLPPYLKHCVDDPAFLVQAAEQLGVPSDRIEELFEAIVSGASSREWLLKHTASRQRSHFEAIYAFEVAVRSLHKLVHESLTDDHRAKLSLATNQPRALAFRLLFNHCSFWCAKHMHDQLGKMLLHQRGTRCLVRSTEAELAEVISTLEEKGFMIKSDPVGEADLSTLQPGLHCKAQAEVSWQEYGQAHWDCCKALLSEKPRAHMDTISRYLAWRLLFEDEIHVTEADQVPRFERFVDGRWECREIRHLSEIIAPLLKDMLPTNVSWDIARFSQQLVEPTTARLLRIQTKLPPLDGDVSRGKLLFQDDIVYDFHTGTSEPVKASHRMSKRAGMRFEVWAPPAGAPDLFGLVEQWLPKTTEQLEDDELGRRIIEAFEELKEYSSLLRFLYKTHLDWNAVLLKGRLVSVMFAALAWYRMLHYLYGSGGSSKDTECLMYYVALGDLATTLTSKYATSKAETKESVNPNFLSTMGCRMIWMSEVEKHRTLAEEFLKGASEQAGAPMKARGRKREPVEFRVMAQIFMTSNNAPKYSDPAGGFAQRLCLWEMPNIFTQSDIDPELRDMIQQGAFNSQLLWLAIGFYKSVTPSFNPGTVLSPKPSNMQLVEKKLKENAPAKRLQEFIKFRCCWCDRASATPVEAWRTAAAAYCGVDFGDIGTLLANAGLKSESRGGSCGEGGRIITVLKKANGAGNKTCLRLLTEEEFKKVKIESASSEAASSSKLPDPFA